MHILKKAKVTGCRNFLSQDAYPQSRSVELAASSLCLGLYPASCCMSRRSAPEPEERPGLVARFWAFVSKFLFLINLIMLVPVAVASFAPVVSPNTWFWPAILAIVLPYLLLIPLLWSVGWVWRKRWVYALANLLLLAVNYQAVPNTYRTGSALARSEQDFRVMSYNVSAFKYRYEPLAEMAQMLEQAPPDVLVVQEFRNSVKRSPTDYKDYGVPVLSGVADLKYSKFIRFNPVVDFGMAFFSRYPIVDAGLVTPENDSSNNGVAYVDIRLYGQVLRVYNVHLESYNFSLMQRRMLNPERNAQDVSTTGAWGLVKAMLRAWHRQEQQLEHFLAHKAAWKGPVVVCSDLNNPPYGYMYTHLAEGLTDSFKARGSGFGRTYRDGWGLPLRIDYLFTNDSLVVVDHTVHRDITASDHYPVSASLRFAY